MMPALQLPQRMACCTVLGNLSKKSELEPDAQSHQEGIVNVASVEFAIPIRETVTAHLPHLGHETQSVLDASKVKQHTELFSAIQGDQWENVILFLETGSFFGCGDENAFSLFRWGVEAPPRDPTSQVRTWVVGYDWWGGVSSKRLPIHEAVVKKAPIALIQKLIEVYPVSVRCKDMDGNLPLHLSFKHNSPDCVVAFLLKSYPEAVGLKNNEGHQPVDYASDDACEIIQICVEQTNRVAQREEARLGKALETEKTRLTEILLQLSEIRGELDLLRKTKMKGALEPKLRPLADNNIEEAKIDEIHENLNVVCPKKKKPNLKGRLPWMKKGSRHGWEGGIR